MLYECSLSTYTETMAQAEAALGEAAREYEVLFEQDDTEYLVSRIAAEFPQLGIGVRQGLSCRTGKDGTGRATEILVFYDLEEVLPDGIIEIYDNATVPELVAMLASAAEPEIENPQCRIVLPE